MSLAEPEIESAACEKGATPRALQAAIEVMARWECERAKSPLDRVMNAESRSRRYLNSGERRWMTDAVYGSVRFLRRLRFLLERLELPDSPENRVRLWATVSASAAGTAIPGPFALRDAAELAPLESIGAALDALPTLSSPREFLRIALSFSDEMANELEAQLGREAILAATAFNARAPMNLRVNTLRSDRETVAESLPDAMPTRLSPWGLALKRRANIHDMPGFRIGRFEAQEEASQLIALLTGAKPGDVVADIGAGAGGKTLALAAMLENEGRIFALEPSEPKLEELRERAQRAGAKCVTALRVPADAEGRWSPAGAAARSLPRLKGTADVVLLDAPCAGSGVLRRAPDTKWREADLAAFARLQQTILEQSSALVKPGGALLYATCAFERIQNEGVAEAFLRSEAGAGFSVEPISEAFPAFVALTSGPYFRSWPHRHGLDAFFGARFRRHS